jgi:hypothetical protein
MRFEVEDYRGKYNNLYILSGNSSLGMLYKNFYSNLMRNGAC